MPTFQHDLIPCIRGKKDASTYTYVHSMIIYNVDPQQDSEVIIISVPCSGGEICAKMVCMQNAFCKSGHICD